MTSPAHAKGAADPGTAEAVPPPAEPAVTDVLRRHYLQMTLGLEDLSPGGRAGVPHDGRRLRRKHHTTRVALGSALATILAFVLLLGVISLATGEDEEGEDVEGDSASASVSADVEFQSETAAASEGAALGGAAVAGGTAGAGGSTGGSQASGAVVSGPVAQDPGAGGGGEGGPGGATTAGPKLLVPKQGVYTFAGIGQSELEAIGLKSTTPLPSTMNVIVTGGGNCWTIKYLHSTAHEEAVTYCATPDGGLTSDRSAVSQTIFGQHIDIKGTCSVPGRWVVPGMTPGQSWPGKCEMKSSGVVSSNFTAEGPVTFVGVETVDVGGTPVQAYHMRKDDAITGSMAGSSAFELWIAVEDGMILRFRRVQSSDGFAKLSEDYDLRLQSLTPRT